MAVQKANLCGVFDVSVVSVDGPPQCSGGPPLQQHRGHPTRKIRRRPPPPHELIDVTIGAEKS